MIVAPEIVAQIKLVLGAAIAATFYRSTSLIKACMRNANASICESTATARSTLVESLP